ncbi:MAG: abortive infection family protein [Ignavibacteriales bacterium]|nr:MAG: abortive infection family protein [Ignavibacteriales bacterium]
MSDLTFIEKKHLEDLLVMHSGYVLDFSDRTFREFIIDTIGLDVYDDKYLGVSGSKANRLRQLIKIEPNNIVGKLLSELLDYWLILAQKNVYDYASNEATYKECKKIAARLKQDSIVENIDAIQPINDDGDFDLLAKSIRESIENNQPEAALDRLHTYNVKFFRGLCEKHSISYEKSDSLNALYGKYIKFINSTGFIESEMAEKILKYSINIMDAFNDIRNYRSFAHDNRLLNYEESLLICNNVTSTIRFVNFIESSIEKQKPKEEFNINDLPF